MSFLIKIGGERKLFSIQIKNVSVNVDLINKSLLQTASRIDCFHYSTIMGNMQTNSLGQLLLFKILV